jgi:tRNA pseudouridine55 synthase
MKRPARDKVDGVLLLDKSGGLTSNDALIRARRLLNAAKAGHGGTLDPMATGVLPLLFGEATKFAHGLLDADKTYLADVVLGETTDTGDADGVSTGTAPVACTADQFAECARSFVGEIDQIPPMHSALKRDGRPLYEYARAGVTLERAARRIRIHALELVSFDAPRAVIRVRCSKGTYIRTLAEDIGARLGCGAHLGALRREAVGAWTLADAHTLASLEAMAPQARRAALLPIDALLAALPVVELEAAQAARFLDGQRLRLHPPGQREPGGQQVRVYGTARLLGVAVLNDGLLAPQRLVAGARAPSETNIDADGTCLAQAGGARISPHSLESEA